LIEYLFNEIGVVKAYSSQEFSRFGGMGFRQGQGLRTPADWK
jgi:hypothetical protein